MNQACRQWFFGGSCVRADPDKKRTKSERDGTIAGIFFVCFVIFLVSFCVCLFVDVDVQDSEKCPWCACLALMLLMLLILRIGIAALQEVSAVVSVML